MLSVFGRRAAVWAGSHIRGRFSAVHAPVVCALRHPWALPAPAAGVHVAHSSSSSAAAVLHDAEDADVVDDDDDTSGAVPLSAVPGLDDSVVGALTAGGITSLFHVQHRTIGQAMSGLDMVVRSKTGTGKTIGFITPVLQAMAADAAASDAGATPRRRPRALVLTPTRELASQVETEFRRFTPALGLRCVCLYGGVPYARQIPALRQGVDVVVGTPGRVVDLLTRGELDLSGVQHAILDEADDMLRIGFKEEVERVYAHLNEGDRVQHMLWSATVPAWVRTLAKRFMQEPVFVDLVGDDAAKLPDTLLTVAVPVAPSDRTTAIPSLIAHYARDDDGKPGRTLVFAETKVQAVELSSNLTLAGGDRAAVLTGDLSQNARELTLRAFREGAVRCLIATDVAARGLDIPQVELILQHSVPRDDDSFVHRSGRAGRAGRTGTNLILYQPRSYEMRRLKELEAHVGAGFEYRAVPASAAVSDTEASAVATRLQSAAVHRLPAATSALLAGLEEEVKATFPSPDDALHAALRCLLVPDDPVHFSLVTGKPHTQTLKLLTRRDNDRAVKTIQRLRRECGVDPFGPTQPCEGGMLFDMPQEAVDLMLSQKDVALVDHLSRKDVRLMNRRPGGDKRFSGRNGGHNNRGWRRDGRGGGGRDRGGGGGGGGGEWRRSGGGGGGGGYQWRDGSGRGRGRGDRDSSWGGKGDRRGHNGDRRGDRRRNGRRRGGDGGDDLWSGGDGSFKKFLHGL